MFFEGVVGLYRDLVLVAELSRVHSRFEFLDELERVPHLALPVIRPKLSVDVIKVRRVTLSVYRCRQSHREVTRPLSATENLQIARFWGLEGFGGIWRQIIGLRPCAVTTLKWNRLSQFNILHSVMRRCSQGSSEALNVGVELSVLGSRVDLDRRVKLSDI